MNCEWCHNDDLECTCRFCESCGERIEPDDDTIYVSHYFKKTKNLIHAECEQEWIDECNYAELCDREDMMYGDHPRSWEDC